MFKSLHILFKLIVICMVLIGFLVSATVFAAAGIEVDPSPMAVYLYYDLYHNIHQEGDFAPLLARDQNIPEEPIYIATSRPWFKFKIGSMRSQYFQEIVPPESHNFFERTLGTYLVKKRQPWLFSFTTTKLDFNVIHVTSHDTNILPYFNEKMVF